MSNVQILVVEDESIIAKGIQSDLQSLGYDVPVIAASGEEALEQAAQTYPDLVLMDIVLKGNLDGIETSRRMRDQFDIPVVYLSAYRDDHTLERAKVTEPFGYLLKPYEERELRTTIEMALHKHRIDRQLRITEQWLAATLNCITDAVIATDARQCIQFINPIAERLTGWSRGEAFSKPLAEVFQVAGEPADTLIEALAGRTFREGKAANLPCPSHLLTRAGASTPVEGSVATIQDEAAGFAGYVWVFRDISERLRMEEERRRSEAQLRELQKMKAVSRLAGGVAHDFNNLLTIILGNASWVLGDLSETDSSRENLLAIETAALRAAESVKQLQNFSGQTNLRMEPVDLNRFEPEMVVFLQQICGPRIRVESRSIPDLWTVQADLIQIVELLQNLTANARDAMPEGGRLQVEFANVVIHEDYVRGHHQARPGEFVRLRVEDTGTGIPPEVRSHIFEPYFTTKELGKGTGLGLALVFGIVDQHDGWIDCSSEVNRGACFDIYLPRYLQEAAVQPVAAEPRVSKTSTKTILLVDDEPTIRDLGRTILQGYGYHVLLAEDGLQAVESYQRAKDQIDLVILDMTMPRMSGADALRHLVQINPEVRVLLSTGYSADQLMEGDDRVLGVISKPYRPRDLANYVHAALEQASVPLKDTLLLLMNQLELALTAETDGRERTWAGRVGETLVRIEKSLRQQVTDVSASDERFADVDQSRPSLVRQLDGLRRRYAAVLEQCAALKAEAMAASQAMNLPDCVALLGRVEQFLAILKSQRQDEMNLVMESVTTDIGTGD